jgi:hypothetical protein
MSNLRIALCLGILLFAGMSFAENSAMNSKPVEPADHASAIFKLAGEFRAVFANLLWIKADAYHHEFIEHNPHWCENKDLLGLMKMITALDPRFEEAYSTGAYILMYGYDDMPKSLSYLHQGLAANPDSQELNRLAAIIYAHNLKQPERALPYARKAVLYSEDDWTRSQNVRLLRTIRQMVAKTQSKQQS